MNIVFVLPGRGSSGGVRATSIFAADLHLRGHKVRILYRADERNIRSLAKGVRNRLIYAGAPDWLYRFNGRIDSFRDIRKCKFEPDEIIVAVGMAMCADLDLLKVENCKIQFFHGSWDPSLLQRAMNLPFPKIVVSSYLKDLAQTSGRGEVLGVVPNGVDQTEYFNCVPVSEKTGVGTIYSSAIPKDPVTTLATLKELALRRRDIKIRVFGSDRRPRELKPELYYRFPSLERAREIYSRSLVWIVASSSEGFSLPVLEAMSCGCCVVATDCGGTRDLIVGGKNGFLVPVGDAHAIVTMVEMLLDDRNLCRQIANEALKTSARFTWQKAVTKFEVCLNFSRSHAYQ